MATDPFQLFDAWFAEARAAEINDPEAMALASADQLGKELAKVTAGTATAQAH